MQTLKCPLQIASLSDDQGPGKPASTHHTEMMSRVLAPPPPPLHDGDAAVTLGSADTATSAFRRADAQEDGLPLKPY